MQSNQKPQLHQDWIDPHALGIVRTLQKEGFTTYLVGGCVRDLLLGLRPKDFDIATLALPKEVRRVIHNSYIIGKRFRLVLVKRADQQFEVATFRRDVREDEEVEEGIQGDNYFGTPQEDARRRDFTINALFYDPVKDDLIDYADGLADLKKGIVKMIGEPGQRLREDSIRILRAIRLAHKIRFTLDYNLRAAIQENASALATSALPRRREEWLKFLRLENPSLAFLDAEDLGVLSTVSPRLHQALTENERTEEFLLHLRQFSDFSWNQNIPVELFGGLIHAYVRTFLHPDPEEPLRAQQLIENPELLSLMKDELGMFKFEQHLVAKALQLQNILSRRADFEKRGLRRQLAVLQSEAFPLALKFAEKDFSMSFEDRYFWWQRFEESQPEIQLLQSAQKRARRRRPRKKKKEGATAALPNGEAEGADTSLNEGPIAKSTKADDNSTSTAVSAEESHKG